MTKYIDADRLRAEIKKSINEIVMDALDHDAGIEKIASAKYRKDALCDVLSIIDSLQQENRALEEAARHVYESWMGGTMDDVRQDMGELGRVIDARKEEHKSNPIFDECVANVGQKVREEVRKNIDFEQALYDHFGQVKDFTLGMRIGQYFYELGCTRTAEKYDEIEYNRQRAEESVPNDLEEAARKYQESVPVDTTIHYCGADEDVYFANRIVDAVIFGAKWQAEQFEKNRLAACDNMSKEEYDRETDFVDSIIKNEHRQPTFSDAINYGMRLQPLPEDTVIYQKGVEEGKRLMMEEAVEGKIAERVQGKLYARCQVPKTMGVEFGDKVRVIICKKKE